MHWRHCAHAQRQGPPSRSLSSSTEQSQGLAHPGYLPGKATGQHRPYDDRFTITDTHHYSHRNTVVSVPCRASAKNAKWRKDSLVRHFLNPDYCGSVRADGVYTHYRRRHDPLLHGTNSRALRVDRLDRTINSYTCPARGGLEAPAYKRLTRQ